MTTSSPPDPVSAVVLAGGEPDRLARQAGVRHKAFVPVAGKPMVSYVLDALQKSTLVASWLYVGSQDAVLDKFGIPVLPPGPSFADSVRLGVEAALAAHPQRSVLVITTDMPWLEPEAIDDLVAHAADYDFVYPIVEESVYMQQFPELTRTFVRLADGRFTGGNPVIFRPQTLPVLLPFIDRVHRDRKNPVALARLFGARIVWRLLTRQVQIADFERRIQEVLGISVGVYASPFASLAADIDTPEHLANAQKTRPNAARS